MSSVEFWKELLRVALLGTERQPVVVPKSADRLGEVLAAVKNEDREGMLLSAAAAISVYRAAGYAPEVQKDPLALCEPDDLPPCNARAAKYLGQMLEGTHFEVLPEWLSAVRAANKRVAEEKLPELLDLGKQERSLRAQIAPVLGKRGVWLAGLNPAWSYATAAGAETAQEVDDLWQTGEPAARLTLIKRLRGQDPSRARALVESTWNEDSPEHRAAFLNEFCAGLGMADEPFLETALDDKRKEVRQAALRLLSSLPESRLVKRMLERVRPLLSVSSGSKGFLSKLVGDSVRMTVDLPKECDKAMQRDGVTPKPPAGSRKIGEKAFWLQQMLGAVPPEIWNEPQKLPAGKLLQGAMKTDWKEALLHGWALAAARFQDAEWAEALLTSGQLYDFDERAPLLKALPPTRREAVLVELGLRTRLKAEERIQWELLAKTHDSWSVDFAKQVAAYLLEVARSSQAHAYTDFISSSGLRMPSSLGPSIIKQFSTALDQDSLQRGPVERFLSILQFRTDMLEAISES